MNTKRMGKWVIVLFLLAALPGLTAVMAQGQTPEQGESLVAFPWALTETEPNNSVATADEWCADEADEEDDYVSCGQVHGGIISAANDVDYWELRVPGLYWDEYYDYEDYDSKRVWRDNFPILIDIEAQSIGSPLDATICLYSDDGYQLACNNNTDTLDPLLYYNFESSRHYFLTVQAQNGVGAGANGKYQLLVSTPYLFSAAAAGLGTGTVEGIKFQAGDIMAFSRYMGGYHKWVLLFDLSDLGVKGNVVNLSSGWRNSDHLLMGFAANVTLPGIGRAVTPWEVVLFDPTQLGPATAGSFQLWWDGRQQGLTTSGEKPDAIDWPNWAGSARLLVSTIGNAKVNGAPAGVLTLPDEDLGLWGEQSNPKWSRFLDATLGDPAIIDVVAATYTDYTRSSSDWSTYYGPHLVAQGIPGFSQKDVILLYEENYMDGSGSEEPEYGYFMVWHGPDWGWNYNIDAIQVQSTVMGQQ